MDSLYNRQNKVPELQRLFQSNPNVPIYMKTTRSKAMLYPFFAIFGVGLVGSMYGVTRMARGIKELIVSLSVLHESLSCPFTVIFLESCVGALSLPCHGHYNRNENKITSSDPRYKLARSARSFFESIISSSLNKFWLSSTHRLPTLALYKSILQQSRRLGDPFANLLERDVRRAFRGSTGKGLRSPSKTRQRLEVASKLDALLASALSGNQSATRYLTLCYAQEQLTSTSRLSGTADVSKVRDLCTKRMRKEPFMPAERTHSKSHITRKPACPPHLSFDSCKEPFLRPRFDRHNQSLSMILRNRAKQVQTLLDRHDTLQWALWYAKAEETFYENLGLPDGQGWVDEVVLAVTHLRIQQEQNESNKAKRWNRLESLHRDLTNKYDAEMKLWNIHKSKRPKAK